MKAYLWTNRFMKTWAIMNILLFCAILWADVIPTLLFYGAPSELMAIWGLTFLAFLVLGFFVIAGFKAWRWALILYAVLIFLYAPGALHDVFYYSNNHMRIYLPAKVNAWVEVITFAWAIICIITWIIEICRLRCKAKNSFNVAKG